MTNHTECCPPTESVHMCNLTARALSVPQGCRSGLETAAQWSMTNRHHCASATATDDSSCGRGTSHTLPILPAGCNGHVTSESVHSHIESIWLTAQVCAIYPHKQKYKQSCNVQMLFKVIPLWTRSIEGCLNWGLNCLSPASKSCYWRCLLRAKVQKTKKTTKKNSSLLRQKKKGL